MLRRCPFSAAGCRFSFRAVFENGRIAVRMLALGDFGQIARFFRKLKLQAITNWFSSIASSRQFSLRNKHKSRLKNQE